jgi:hypothetical protein
MADSQKSEIHETTDDAATSPSSNFERGAADADIKRNPEAGAAAAEGPQPGVKAEPLKDDADESSFGGPLRLQTPEV